MTNTEQKCRYCEVTGRADFIAEHERSWCDKKPEHSSGETVREILKDHRSHIVDWIEVVYKNQDRSALPKTPEQAAELLDRESEAAINQYVVSILEKLKEQARSYHNIPVSGYEVHSVVTAVKCSAIDAAIEAHKHPDKTLERYKGEE